MSDSIGRVVIPDAVDSGLSFPLVPSFPYGMVRPRPVIVHRFGELATKAEQRFEVGIGPRQFQFSRSDLDLTERQALADFYEEVQGSYKLFNYSAPGPDQIFTSYKVR